MSLTQTLRRAALAAALAGAALVATPSAAQQPQPPTAAQPPRPLPAPPGAQPPTGAQPGTRAQPGMPPLPPGHPTFLQGSQPTPGTPPGRPTVRRLDAPPPGLPPGVRRPLPPQPTKAVAHAAAEEHAAPHAAHCPGHGPTDPPGHVNWWHGLIGVDNVKAESGSAFDKLLYRYENHDDHCDPKNEPPPFLASVLNFALLGFIIVRFGRKPVRDALVKRKEAIMHEIDTASRLKDEARARLVDYEQKWETLEDRLEEMRAEYAAQSDTEKKRVIAEAEERRTRMRRDAEFRIEQELKAARIEVLDDAATRAVAAAEALLRSHVGRADADRLNDEYLASLAQVMAPAPQASSTRGGAA